MEIPSAVESPSGGGGGGGRQLVVGVHDTEASLKALKYVVKEISRASDVIHVVTVVPCLLPDQEIFHGIPGTSYKFQDPRPHHELDDIVTAREFLKERVEPILEGTAAKHKLHLLVDTKDTPAKAFGETITKTAQAVQADMVVVGGRDAEPGEDVAGLGAVAHWLTRHPPGMPLILVPDGWQPSRHVENV